MGPLGKALAATAEIGGLCLFVAGVIALAMAMGG